jgi:acyl carrier protein
LSTESSMAEQTAAQHELATLIVECLNLDTVTADQIDPDLPLFGGDLGLDSIDALEIALAVSKRHGFQLRSDNPDNRQIFTSLRTLSAHVEQHRVS